jgi:hypothetical protein
VQAEDRRGDMKGYYLNILFESEDNLVAHYDSLKDLRSHWVNDCRIFLESQGLKQDTDTEWYPYFTRIYRNGEIRELLPSEVLRTAA